MAKITRFFKLALQFILRLPPTVYLAGGMEKAKRLGAGWREELTPFLLNLGFTVFDPVALETKKLAKSRPKRLPHTYKTITGEKCKLAYWHQLKDAYNKKLQRWFKDRMRIVINYDLDIVNKSNIVIAYWDEAAKNGGGTYGEIQSAWQHGVPVYAVVEAEIPAWTAAQCEQLFTSFSDLKRFLKKKYG